ncbi:hypothetical protein DL93DRAFT_2222776 [Clavulina sp. PMI_390]|nr:hypothetical protein DL93DRAFT_2222776 [Clavulina sp. PMI_390]
MSSYKSAKEAFVSDTTGSSIFHINSISLVALSSIFLHSAVSTRVRRRDVQNNTSITSEVAGFISDFFLLVFPMLLSMTFFAERPLVLSSLISIPALALVLFKPSLASQNALLPTPSSHTGHTQSRPTSPSPSSKHPSTGSMADLYESAINNSAQAISSSEQRSVPARESRLFVVPYLTTYRSHMLLMTLLAILAVDFPVFPRSLAKCESFGVSLMDLGVGSFVFSQGLVAAIPMLRDPKYLTSAVMPKISKAFRKVLPLLALGLIRVILVKGTDYPEHVTEYGVHWNFFITMALMGPLSVLLHPLMESLSIAFVALLITSFHEITLRSTNLGKWGLGDNRDSIISQNKEGVVSLPGYLAIHTFGLLMGTLLLPPSPSTFRHMQKQAKNSDSKPLVNGDARPTSDRREPDKAAIELFSYAVGWWTLLGVLALSLPAMSSSWKSPRTGEIWEIRPKSNISRRLANMPYVLWIAAYNTSFLLGYLLLDTAFFHVSEPGKFPYKNVSKRPVSSTTRRDASPVRRSDRGPGVSPTEAAVAAASSYEYSRWEEAASGESSSIMSTPSSAARLKRSSSKRAPHNDSSDLSERVDHYDPLQLIIPTPKAGSTAHRKAPELLEAINKNGLMVFLLANVLTGLVNLSLQTMFAPDNVAMAVLTVYSAVVCGVAWALRYKRLL